MSERKYPFVVGNKSDEKEIEKALTALRNMVEHGKKAEAALRALERDGCWTKSVLVADPPREYGNQRERRLPQLRFVKFPPFQEISREDAPHLSTLTLTLGSGHRAQYGGHECIEYNLNLTGTALVETKGAFVPKELPPTRIGGLRVSRRAISFIDSSNNARLVTTRCKTLKPMVAKVAESEAIDAIAGLMVNMALQRMPDKEFTQKGLDLWKSVRTWLVKDGHVLRMLEGIVEQLWVKWTVESVMDA